MPNRNVLGERIEPSEPPPNDGRCPECGAPLVKSVIDSEWKCEKECGAEIGQS